MIAELTLYIPPLPPPPKKKNNKKGGVAFCYFFSTKYNVHIYLATFFSFSFFQKLERDRIVKSVISVIFGVMRRVFFFYTVHLGYTRMNSTAARSIGHKTPPQCSAPVPSDALL